MATNIQDPIVLSIFRWDDPNHPLNHTKAKRAYLKRILPLEKFEQLMILAYTDDMPPSLIDDDCDSENVVHEEGLNEMLTGFFGDGNNDDNNDHLDDNNNDIRGNYHQHNVDDKNLKDYIKQAAKTPVFK